MASKNLEISELLDLYGGMLTEKQLLLTRYYYDDDLSLAEIAENEGITRQGVRDIIKRGEAQLLECELKLGLKNQLAEVESIANQIKICATKIQKQIGGEAADIAQKIIDLSNRL